MRCLVAIDEADVRDVVASAAASFAEFEIDAVDTTTARDLLRRRRYEAALGVLKSGSRHNDVFWQEVRALDPDLLLVAFTPAAAIAGRKGDRQQLRLFALLGLPVDAVELYSTIRRVIDRAKKPRPAPDAATP